MQREGREEGLKYRYGPTLPLAKVQSGFSKPCSGRGRSLAPPILARPAETSAGKTLPRQFRESLSHP